LPCYEDDAEAHTYAHGAAAHAIASSEH